jgi:hypothetical protein
VETLSHFISTSQSFDNDVSTLVTEFESLLPDAISKVGAANISMQFHESKPFHIAMAYAL